MTRRRGYAFFSELGGGRQKKNMAIPPGYRRILKKGDFNTPPQSDFSKKENGGFDDYSKPPYALAAEQRLSVSSWLKEISLLFAEYHSFD